MKPSLALLAALLLAAPAAFAHDGHDHDNAAPATDAKSAYPLEICVVSGDKLGGDMGTPVDFIYQEKGKPDRLVRFCCKDCIADFKKDAIKYLKKLDEAAAAKAKK